MGAVCSDESADNVTPAKSKNTQRRSIKASAGDDEDDLIEMLTTPGPLDEQSKAEVIASFKAAVHDEKYEMVMFMEQQYPSLNLLDTELDSGDTVLHVAVRKNARKLLLYCLEHGLSPKMKNVQSGDNALHMAVATENVRTVAILLRYGADPRAPNKAGRDARELAEEMKNDDIIELVGDQSVDMFATTFRGTSSFREIPGLEDAESSGRLKEAAHSVLKANNLSAPAPQSQGDDFGFLQSDSSRTATAALVALDGKRFPVLNGWLEKRTASLPHSWHKRWVIVKESWMLWSEIEVECADPREKEERVKFKNVSLLQVEKIERIDAGKVAHHGTKFKVVVSIGAKKKNILWRCKNVQERNRWVLDLQYRVEHAKSVVDFLSDDIVEIF